ncbi:MAG: DNA mismatch repair protein MutS [Lachnospiraceae bacterium]
MKKLGIDQRKSIGFQFVLEQMTPDTPYGYDEIKGVKPYKRSEREELLRELYELGCVVQGMEEYTVEFGQLERIMMTMKEVRGSLKKAKKMCLSDVEFFELKSVLIQIDKMLPIFNELKTKLNLNYITLEDVTNPLNVLDPEKKRIPSFYISEAYSESLGKTRIRKKQIEVSLRQEHSEAKLQELGRERRELVILEDEQEQAVRIMLTEQIRGDLDLISENLNMVGCLDFIIQKAKIAIKFHGIPPIITDSELYFQSMQNPQIQDSLGAKGKKFAPVTIEMSEGVTVITGANMGGKSVALRTVVLNLYLAQCGFYVFSAEAKVPLLDYLFLIAEEFQSMKDGLSSFGGEIVRLKEALNEIPNGFGFLMLDELARGTNPHEGAQIVRAVVRYLNTQKAMTLLATHYDHVAEYANRHYQVYGLKKKSMESMEQELSGLGEQERIDLIGRYMDYGIYRVLDQEDCPRDAIHVCYLLGLQKEVLNYINTES